ncbi:MAG: tetratricopeptide repeat protein, partial [Planctomycetota bacterium]
PSGFVKALSAAGGLVVIFVFLNYAVISPIKSAAKIDKVEQAVLLDQFKQAHNLLDAASEDDRLNPVALNRNARLYLQRFHASVSEPVDLLLDSEQHFLAAIQRDKADYQNFEHLIEVYTLIAETSKKEQKADWLQKAFDSAKRAVELYPGIGRLRFELAKIAEQLGKEEIAIAQYNKAIDIEDGYRQQFRTMYPDRALFSRLGEEKYKNAKQRITILSNQSTP